MHPARNDCMDWFAQILVDDISLSYKFNRLGKYMCRAGHMLLKEASGSNGREVVPYMGPRPPIGIHRYIFVLFKQPTEPIVISPPPARNNFNTRNFAGEYGLGLPVAATYFNAQKEPGNRRR